MTDSVVTHETASPPPALAPLYAAIQESRYFLAWDDDWDDEGSPAYDEAVWRRATDFLLRTATHLLERQQLVTATPRITAGPDGSIDIDWTNDTRVLLLNIPASAEEFPTFYGKDDVGNVIEGQLSLDTDGTWLLMWATR